MLNRLPDRDPAPYDDDWEDQPAASPFHQYGLGVLLAILLAGYGIYGIIHHQIDFGGRIIATFYNQNATALGIAFIALALFVHCHYFWGNIYNQAWLAVLGKIIAACVFIAALAFFLIRNGILGKT